MSLLAAGQRAANIKSLLETARLKGLEPYAWLKSVLMQLTIHRLE
ncbi:transposase domain-containing protein [Serratia sp. UGAL515B_01]|nr:transposase domain-containing protein [Serratia sp. UGAL515B_01]WON77397.1 transposase domain-containing protein [Serratia sp. UGAL515B_01]